MTQDFAKIKPEPLLERKPVATPPAWSLMVTGIVVGIAIGVFGCFLFYMSGNVPALNASVSSPSSLLESSATVAAAEPVVETPLEFEFYNELQEYEVEVDAIPVTIASEEPPPVIDASANAATATNTDSIPTSAPANAAPNTAASTAPAVVDRALDERIMLQTGAFRQQDLANIEMRRLQALGLSVMVKRQDLVSGTLFLVQTGPYDSSVQLSNAERVLESNNIASMPLSLR